MADSIMPNRSLSIIYGFFLSSMRLRRWSSLFRRTWNIAWDRSTHTWSGPVSAVIHGKKVTVNYGYNYPVFCREFPTYNNPLVELVYLAYASKGGPVVVVDVGAAIGDTILLIESNCPEMMSYFYCIDGDELFFSFLESNLSGKDGKLLKRFLASSETIAKSLVRIHPGTASSQGEHTVETTSLDCLMHQGEIGRFDLLKIDVDGYDGAILQGAKECLEAYAPAVIFEWHPQLCVDTENSWLDHFTALRECGYDRLLWFDNYGNFSHFSGLDDELSMDALASVCLNGKHARAVFFDIVALPKGSSIPNAMAELNYARTKRSPF